MCSTGVKRYDSAHFFFFAFEFVSGATVVVDNVSSGNVDGVVIGAETSTVVAAVVVGAVVSAIAVVVVVVVVVVVGKL